MTGGAQSDPSGQPIEPEPPGERMWQHPSEVGLATRGRSDRRRSTLIAAGVMIGGIGILLTGVLIGSTDGGEPASPTPGPTDRMVRSVAHVTVVGTDSTTMVTGLVLDEDGNLMVPADSLNDGDEIWARCGDGDSELVQVLGTDDVANIAVLHLAKPEGSPAEAADPMPPVGSALVVVHSERGKELSMREGTLSSADASAPGSATDPGPRAVEVPSPWIWAEVSDAPDGGPSAGTTDLSGGLVFDRGARFVGMSTSPGEPTGAGGSGGSGSTTSLVEVLSADTAMRAANRIIATS